MHQDKEPPREWASSLISASGAMRVLGPANPTPAIAAPPVLLTLPVARVRQEESPSKVVETNCSRTRGLLHLKIEQSDLEDMYGALPLDSLTRNLDMQALEVIIDGHLLRNPGVDAATTSAASRWTSTSSVCERYCRMTSASVTAAPSTASVTAAPPFASVTAAPPEALQNDGLLGRLDGAAPSGEMRLVNWIDLGELKAGRAATMAKSFRARGGMVGAGQNAQQPNAQPSNAQPSNAQPTNAQPALEGYGWYFEPGANWRAKLVRLDPGTNKIAQLRVLTDGRVETGPLTDVADDLLRPCDLHIHEFDLGTQVFKGLERTLVTAHYLMFDDEGISVPCYGVRAADAPIYAEIVCAVNEISGSPAMAYRNGPGTSDSDASSQGGGRSKLAPLLSMPFRTGPRLQRQLKSVMDTTAYTLPFRDLACTTSVTVR